MTEQSGSEPLSGVLIHFALLFSGSRERGAGLCVVLNELQPGSQV